MPMGDYLARLESSTDAQVPGSPRPHAPPPPPQWGSGGAGPYDPPGRDSPSAPAMMSRAPASLNDAPPSGRRFRTRDLVIFGAVIGLVVVAAVVAVLVVLLKSG
jgi:hypothetical protein